MTDQAGAVPTTPSRVLAEVTAALASGDDLDAALGRLLTSATSAVAAPVGVLYLQDPDRAELQLGVTIGLDDMRRAEVEAAVATRDDAPGTVARERIATVTTSGAFVRAAGVSSASFHPLAISRGGLELPLGVLGVGWDEAHTLSPEETAILDAIAAASAVAVDRGRLASMIAERSEWFERVAQADALTGLANQRTFVRILELELARAGRQGGDVSVAIFDVDSFAATNASAGHRTGDDILRAVAAVLAESVRLVDTVARYGGDEFVVVAPGAAGLTVARRVLDGVARLKPINGQPVSISAGVARFPVDGATSEELLHAAVAALGEARSSGRGGIASATVSAA